MKIRTSIALLAIIFTGCKTRHIEPPGCDTAPNTITVTDDGVSYCIGGYGLRLNPLNNQDYRNNVAALCYDNNTTSMLDFLGDGATFSLTYFNSYGPPHGIGTYTWPANATKAGTFTEKFTGGKTYNVTGGTVTVTHADSMHVQATFELTVSDNINTKTITGRISTTKP